MELEFKTISKRLLGDESGGDVDSEVRKSSVGVQTDLFGNAVETAIEEPEVITVIQPQRNISNTPHEYELVESQEEIKMLLEELKKHTEISFDTETTGIDANNADLV